ncbi:MAG: hypothetical protein JNK35_01715 [Phycisphaerae bacterium]|nr:hypothetical protein [Phycisphaerae bacterium]
MLPVFNGLNLRCADSVAEAFRAGASACLSAKCRRGSIEEIDLGAPLPETGRLVATGDLHDNPVHLARVLQAAGLDDPARPHTDRAHLTLHELIHGDQLVQEMDFSYRTLCRAAHLKAAFPEHAHVLLANHELSQIVGAGVMKDGVDCVAAFNDAVDHTFGDAAGPVHEAIKGFIRALPLALRVRGAAISPPPGGGKIPGDKVVGTLLCAHSLPAPELMDRFDVTVLSRALDDDDYIPRRGSAHLMVWGRGHTPEHVEGLATLLGVDAFVLGHEKADSGVHRISPRALVINSDHSRGAFCVITPSSHTITWLSSESGRKPE